jgi:hypothetical protein
MCNSRVKVRHLAKFGYAVFPALPATLSCFLLHTEGPGPRAQDSRLSAIHTSSLGSLVHGRKAKQSKAKRKGKKKVVIIQCLTP